MRTKQRFSLKVEAQQAQYRLDHPEMFKPAPPIQPVKVEAPYRPEPAPLYGPCGSDVGIG